MTKAVIQFVIIMATLFGIEIGRVGKKYDWNESKKETKLVALRHKKRKNAAQSLLAGPKRTQNFEFLKIC